MALFALTSTYVMINSVDYSDHCKSASLVIDVNQLDTTDFDSLGWTEVIGGLKSGTLNVSFMDDVAAANVDSNLWTLAGTVVTFELRATDSAVGAGNPKYTGSIMINAASLGGAVGELAMKNSYSFPTSGVVTRAIV